MEHQHMMWMQRRQMFMMNSIKDTYSSWEDGAYEDQCCVIWPPRSYSCSFCKKKFRSAQALGGHMNVHRRDRARLQQQSSPQTDSNVDDDDDGDVQVVDVVNVSGESLIKERATNSSHHSHINLKNSSSPPKSMESHIYNDHDHDSNSSINNHILASTLSISSRASTLSTQKTLSSGTNHTFFSCNDSKDKQEPCRVFDEPNSKQEKLEKNIINASREKVATTSLSLGHNHELVRDVDTNLSMGFNSVTSRRINTSMSSSCVTEAISNKRLKGDASTVSIIVKPYCSSSSNGIIGHKCHSGSKEDIDLELRLGGSPKVN